MVWVTFCLIFSKGGGHKYSAQCGKQRCCFGMEKSMAKTEWQWISDHSFAALPINSWRWSLLILRFKHANEVNTPNISLCEISTTCQWEKKHSAAEKIIKHGKAMCFNLYAGRQWSASSMLGLTKQSEWDNDLSAESIPTTHCRKTYHLQLWPACFTNVWRHHARTS